MLLELCVRVEEDASASTGIFPLCGTQHFLLLKNIDKIIMKLSNYRCTWEIHNKTTSGYTFVNFKVFYSLGQLQPTPSQAKERPEASEEVICMSIV